MLLFFCFFGFPEGFYKTKTTFEKTNNTKENQRKQKKPSGKQTKTKCLKVSDPPLDMVFLFVVLVFQKVFTKPKQPSRKPTIPKTTKENKQNLRENQTKKQSF